MIAKKNNKVEIDISSWFSLSADLDADCRGWFLNLSIHFLDKGTLPEDNEKLAVLANVKFSEFQRFSEVFDSVILPLIKKLPVKKAKITSEMALFTSSKFDFKFELLKIGANHQLVNDWLLIRQKKKASNTQTALQGFLTQLRISGKTINDVLTICCDRDWKGFHADWLKNIDQENKSNQQESNNQVLGRMSAETALKNANNFNNVTIPD